MNLSAMIYKPCYMPLLADTKKGENTGRMNDRINKEFKHTQCEWKPFRFRPVPERSATYEEIKSMLCESMDRTVKHGDSINDFYMVLSQWNDDPVYTALVGNGPTSEENARFIASAPDMLDALIEAFFGEATASEETRYKWQMIIEKATGLSIQEVLEIVSTRRASAIREVASNGI